MERGSHEYANYLVSILNVGLNMPNAASGEAF